MSINWNGHGNGFADFIRQFDPQTGQPVDPTQGQSATFGGTPPRDDHPAPQGDTSWWGGATTPQGGAYGGYAPAPPSDYGHGTGGWYDQSAPATPAPPSNPGQQGGSYFPNDPNNPLTTAARAQYDMNPTLAWQRVVGQTVTNPNSPQYAWARAQYQRYYQDYVQANGLDPNLTFTTYLDQRGPQLAQEFGNAPASARGVNNTWLTSGRFTS